MSLESIQVPAHRSPREGPRKANRAISAAWLLHFDLH